MTTKLSDGTYSFSTVIHKGECLVRSARRWQGNREKITRHASSNSPRAPDRKSTAAQPKHVASERKGSIIARDCQLFCRGKRIYVSNACLVFIHTCQAYSKHPPPALTTAHAVAGAFFVPAAIKKMTKSDSLAPKTLNIASAGCGVAYWRGAWRRVVRAGVSLQAPPGIALACSGRRRMMYTHACRRLPSGSWTSIMLRS